jgi:chaperonin cofactor prefoldin
MEGYGWGGLCGCNCSGPGFYWPRSRNEVVEEMEEYKASLESEIRALEKRIQTLKGKKE